MMVFEWKSNEQWIVAGMMSFWKRRTWTNEKAKSLFCVYLLIFSRGEGGDDEGSVLPFHLRGSWTELMSSHTHIRHTLDTCIPDTLTLDTHVRQHTHTRYIYAHTHTHIPDTHSHTSDNTPGTHIRHTHTRHTHTYTPDTHIRQYTYTRHTHTHIQDTLTPDTHTHTPDTQAHTHRHTQYF